MVLLDDLTPRFPRQVNLFSIITLAVTTSYPDVDVSFWYILMSKSTEEDWGLKLAESFI